MNEKKLNTTYYSSNDSIINDSTQSDDKSELLTINNIPNNDNEDYQSLTNRTIKKEHMNSQELTTHLNFLQMIHNFIKKIINSIWNRGNKKTSSINDKFTNNPILIKLEKKLYEILFELNNEISDDAQYKEYCTKIVNNLYYLYKNNMLDAKANEELSEADIDDYIVGLLSTIDTGSDDNIIPLYTLKNMCEQEIKKLKPAVNYSRKSEIKQKYITFDD